jgi:hypothetical protein
MRAGVMALLLVGCELNPAFDPSIPADGSASGIDPDGAAVQVANLRATWGTPNAIRWDWDAEGDADGLLAFELVVGRSEEDVIERSASTRTWTEVENPELGRFLLPRTGGEDPVVFTVTDELEPDTIHYAQLHAIDTAGNRAVSNVAAGRTTQSPVGEIVIMSDVDTAGISIPNTFVLGTERPYAGSSAYRYEAPCAAQEECWENLRRQEFLIDLSAVSGGSYATTAYFEVALAIENGSTPWWCNLWLWYDASSADFLAHYSGWTARADGEYRLLQVPLREFRIGGEPAPYEELAHGLFGFNVGCPWSGGSLVRVDELRIRW